MERAIFPSSVALISQADQDHFEELWSRRRPGTPSDPIGLKSYFAVRRVIEALDPEAGNTRTRVRDRIEARLVGGEAGARSTGLERLAMIEAGEIVPFPVELFPLPALVPAAPDSTELLPFGFGEGFDPDTR